MKYIDELHELMKKIIHEVQNKALWAMISTKEINESFDNIHDINIKAYHECMYDFKFPSDNDIKNINKSVDELDDAYDRFKLPFSQEEKLTLITLSLNVLRNMIPLYVGTSADVKLKILIDNYNNIKLKLQGVDIREVAREKREKKLEKRRQEKAERLAKHARREVEIQEKKRKRLAAKREERKRNPYTMDHISIEK